MGLFAQGENDGGVFEIARRAKRYYQNMDNSLKLKRSKKKKTGYIYIYSIYYFFFFFSRFFLSLAGAVECRRRPQHPVFPRVFYFQSIKINITLLLPNIVNIICSTFKS